MLEFAAIEAYREHIREVKQQHIAGLGELVTDNNRQSGHKVYVHGSAETMTLKNVPGVVVLDCSMPAGRTVPRHCHKDSIEVFVIVSGVIIVEHDVPDTLWGRIRCLLGYGRKKTRLEHGQVLCLDIGVAHSVAALSETNFVAILMPRDEVFDE